MKRVLFLLVILAFGVYWFGYRHRYYRAESMERSDAGAIPWIQRGFTIAIVWPPHTDASLVEGVTLAAEEVNAAGGPLSGKFKLKFVTETADGGALARDLVKIKDLVLVIGHELEGAAIPASIVYEDHGVLFLSPKSTDSRLTQHQFKFSFRLTPDDREMAIAIAHFMSTRGWKRNVVLHGRSDHGELAAAAFMSLASRSATDALSLAGVHSFFYEPVWYEQDFRPMIATMRAQSFDAIFLAALLPGAAKLLVDMASMGVTQPVIGTDKLDSQQLWQLAGPATNGLYVASSVNPESASPEFGPFRERFRKRFNANPGYGASQGYEAFMLFARASGLSKGADPLVLATTLRTQVWPGLFGDFNFTQSGDIRGRDITIKQMTNGQFHPVFTEERDPSPPDTEQ